MNFSNVNTLRKLLSLILVLTLACALFAGCTKEDNTDNPSDSGPNINLIDDSKPTESQTLPEQTTPTEVNENMGTVTTQLTVRDTPNKDGNILGTLYAGDRVEVTKKATVASQVWGYINYPDSTWQKGWIMMEYVEMDVKEEEPSQGGTDEPDPTTPEENTPPANEGEQNIKGVVTVNNLNIRSEPNDTSKKQGQYNRGDVVSILETSNGWGRTNKGWISMEYVSTSGNVGGSSGNNTGSSGNSGSSGNNSSSGNTGNSGSNGNGSTNVIAKGIVTAKELNIRASASKDSDRVGSLSYGARVEILEKNGSWGRTKDGWIHMDYIYQDGTTGSKTASGIVTGSTLNIRSGPGTGYGKVGSLNSGDRVNILEQFTFNGVTWGCTSKGWISLEYVYIDGTGDGEKTGTITVDGLNIRSGPGTGYDKVGTLNQGMEVTILYEVTVGKTTWGNINKGWISMEYVDLDE